METLAMHHIETYGWLCEDSLCQAVEAEAQGNQREADAYRACAEIWSGRAFKEAEAQS